MISMKAAVAALSLLVGTTTAFDVNQCDIFVFRTEENALWNCGGDTPDSKFCDHSWKEEGVEPYAWKSNHPDEWCDFLISIVRHQKDTDEYYALTPKIGLTESPGPNPAGFHPLLDWGCYVLSDDKSETTHAWMVDSQIGELAVKVDKECEIKKNKRYFSTDLDKRIKNLQWYGHVTDIGYVPERTNYGVCYYDDAEKAPNYLPELDVNHAECNRGYHCEHVYGDYAHCMPDPIIDHECCISWHNKCENVGDCCIGSECQDGYCNPLAEMQLEDPPGICTDHTQIKTQKKLFTACYDFAPVSAEPIQGDCAPGYLCVGDSLGGKCQIDSSVKDDWCKWSWDTVSPRPGDCCLGWMYHCHAEDAQGNCISSQCIPGRGTGSEIINGELVSFLDRHDRMKTDPPPKVSYNEQLGQCTGAQCGVWGDPHIVTCDELHYDCQAVGIFSVMVNHMFNVQAKFIAIEAPWGDASITSDVAFDWVKTPTATRPEDYPTIQFSFPDFTRMEEGVLSFPGQEKSKTIGACPVMFYLDGELTDISIIDQNGGYLAGDENSAFSVKRGSQYNQIDVSYKIDDYYATIKVLVDGSGPWTEWSCIYTYFICLPGEEQEDFKTTSSGLLGVPDGAANNDWMSPDHQTLVIPLHNRAEASYNYCVDNWCVDEDNNILEFEDGTTFEDYKCQGDDFVEFDVYSCENPEEIIEQCRLSPQPIACQIETCAGNPDVDEDIQVVSNITEVGTKDEDNLLEFPNVEEQYGDCTNLGYCLSASCGIGAWSVEYPEYDCKGNVVGGTVGYDNGPSVLVGGNFNCLQGIGFEGRGVFLGDMNLAAGACEDLGFTSHGSLIHPFKNSVCVQVGGTVTMDASFDDPKDINYEPGNSDRACHFLYKGGCSVNGQECPHTLTELADLNVRTNGDFKQDSFMNLEQWEDEITLLKNKAEYWGSLEPNGIVSIRNQKEMFLEPGQDQNPVQIFEIDMIGPEIQFLFIKKDLYDKTILIKVKGDGGDFYVPPFCSKEPDALPGAAYTCGRNGFPSALTTSIVWLFDTANEVTFREPERDEDEALNFEGNSQLMGSVVIPHGSLVLKNQGQSGRLIVGGDLTIDGRLTVLHNYEFDPQSKPLPLPVELDEVCTVTPPVCEENYKVLTSETACPSKPQGIVKLIKSSGDYPEGEPILYDIILDEPDDEGSHTVKFKVDNPFTNYTDIFIKHVKKVGKYALDPVCDKMPFTAGCNIDAPIIEVGCHEYDGIDPFALVNIYFASDSDGFVLDAGNDVTIDKCCKPPKEYETGYGVIEYTFEIQCVCPPDEAAQSS